ncbi:hypothetical protein [Phenylobacterium sp.]|uniref:hypothetical protein n=1 Tax=Phenylobacterium sp. TaxID=1871053 RepID=UPI0035AE6424
MDRARRPAAPRGTAEIIDFDAAMLAACPPELREDLLTEAAMLADACPAEDRPRQLEAIAQTLCEAERQDQAERARARRLAAALRTIARS